MLVIENRIIISVLTRHFSTTPCKNARDSYQLVIVGAGTAGVTTAAKFNRYLPKGSIAVIEPAKYHHYQPGWTLVGGGLKKFEDLRREVSDLVPKKCDLISEKVEGFDPENNIIFLDSNKKLKYDYLIVAAGIQTNFDGIKGLKDALEHDDSVVTNYSPVYVKKTYPAIQRVQSGNAIFTFPNSVIKCAGAPQKIMYLADDCFRRNGVRDKVNVMFNSALPLIFAVQKYANELTKIAKERDIQLNFRTSLVEIDHAKNEAKFEKLDTPGTFVTYNYSLLHVGPPMKPYDFIKHSPIADTNGYVDVDKATLQHKKYTNIFALGDCSNVPTSKTAAAVSAQAPVLFRNLRRVMNGEAVKSEYDGYTSCPLITGYGKLILAEFDFNGNPLETFPFDQGKQRRSMYHLKKDFMPVLYWHGLLKGYWNGTASARKLMHFGKA